MTRDAVVLSQLGDADAIRLPADLRTRVEVVPVPPSEPVPRDVRGDVLLMSFGNDAIYDLVERGVSWVHFLARESIASMFRGSRAAASSRTRAVLPARPHSRAPSARPKHRQDHTDHEYIGVQRVGRRCERVRADLH
jgi:hypothetical protein